MKKFIRYMIIVMLYPLVQEAVHAQGSVEQLLEAGFEKYENGDCAGAIKNYNLVLKSDTKNAEAYYLRGVCKSVSEDNKGAIEDFKLAVKHNPEYAEAFFEMAYSFYTLEDHVKAMQFYNKAIDLDPDYAEAYLNRGSLKHNKNDMEGACEDWTKAEALGINVAYDLIKEYCMF